MGIKELLKAAKDDEVSSDQIKELRDKLESQGLESIKIDSRNSSNDFLNKVYSI